MEIELFFEQNSGRIALEEARFRYASEYRVSRRGSLITYNTSPFRWIPSVCALSLALIRVKTLFLEGNLHEVLLSGGSGSPAQTLHRAAYRSDRRFWDLFGVNASGRSRLFEILHFARPSVAPGRANYRVSFLKGPLRPERIAVFQQQELVTSRSALDEVLSKLSAEFNKLLLPSGARVCGGPDAELSECP